MLGQFGVTGDMALQQIGKDFFLLSCLAISFVTVQYPGPIGSLALLARFGFGIV